MKFRILWLGVPIALLAAAAAVAPITFEDIADRAGVKFVTENGATPAKRQPEGLVAGVAMFDYDGDGYLDLYFVNGGGMPSLQKDDPKFKNRLYHNNGNLTFTDVTDQAGLGGTGYGMGVSVGDYDNDGRPDLYLASLTGNQLFHNNGNGTFTDVTAKAGVGGGSYNGKKMWSVAAVWLDYNNDGLLDLFVSNYCQWDTAGEPQCTANGMPTYCSPRYYKPLPNTLYRNNGNGTFTDVSAATGIADHPGRGMNVAIADYDNDGFTDIFVANDDAPFQLFHNLGGKKFEEVAIDAGVAFTENGNVISGMGADFRDVFNKGLPSIWVTGIEKETFPLFVNVGKGQFEERTSIARIGTDTYEMSGWGNAIVDLDNDGWKDLLVVRSNVQDNISKYSPRKYEEPGSVFRNLSNGKFENVTSTTGDLKTPAAHRGLAIGDLDNDGRMDAVATVLNGQARVLHNTTQSGNHWLLVKLVGVKSNRMGIGTKIKVTATDGSVQYNHATTSAGYASASDSRVHFGMGSSATAKEIEVTWPSGIRQVLTNVAVDKVLTVREAVPAAAPAK